MSDKISERRVTAEEAAVLHRALLRSTELVHEGLLEPKANTNAIPRKEEEMTTDKIAEIKARHERDESWRADGYDPVVGRLPQSHDDRGYLLAEVERLREALTWYCTRVRELNGPYYPRTSYTALLIDEGERARKALEGKP